MRKQIKTRIQSKGIALLLVSMLVLLSSQFTFGQRDSLLLFNLLLQNQLNLQLLIQSDEGKTEAVRELLEKGANIYSTSWDSTTALMYSSQNGHYETSVELLSWFADPNAQNIYGYTPLHYASINNHDSIAELLLLNDAIPHPVTNKGVSPLHFACAYGYPFMAQILLEYGAFIDSTDNYGNTPLLTATYSGSYITAEYLLNSWCDVNKPDKRGNTPLMVAAQHNDTSFIRLLTSYGADALAINSEGNTALSLAIHKKATEAAKILMAKQTIENESKLEYTYADIAYRTENTELLSLLQRNGSILNRKYFVNSSSFNTGFSVNGDDFLLLFNSSIFITGLNMHLGLTYAFRPYNKRVEVHSQFDIYQLFEKRNHLKVYALPNLKKISLSNSSTFVVSAGVAGIYSWGNYSIGNQPFMPQKIYQLTPMIEFSQENRNGFRWSMGAHYSQIDYAKKNPIFFEMKVGYTFKLTEPQLSTKRISWF